MRLAEFALPGGFIADKARELGTLDVEEGLVALRARDISSQASASASATSISLIAWRPRISRRARIRVSRHRTPTVGCRGAD
jgi:hypothetical protein